MVSPISGNIIRTNVVLANPNPHPSNNNNQSQENRFVPFKGKGVALGDQVSSLQQPANRPEIIIENASYHILKDEDPSQADIENQQRIMDLIKKKSNPDKHNDNNSNQ